MIVAQDLVIDQYHCGPPNSGNGGYVCGLVAQFLGDCSTVRLRQPPPLNKPLSIHKLDDGKLELIDGPNCIAEGRTDSLELDIPSPPSFSEAENARQYYRGFKDHPFPTCYVCGPRNEKGLKLFTGQVRDTNIVACTWIPDSHLFDNVGNLNLPIYQSALDCPSAYGVWLSKPKVTTVLGSMTSKIVSPITLGQELIVMGWYINFEGRKYLSGSAIFTKEHQLKAYAQNLWIQVDLAKFA